MKKITCIICDRPAVYTCQSGNTLCADCLTTIRKRKNSVTPDRSPDGASAPAAVSAPGSLAVGVSIQAEGGPT
jgi:hypothetical protein